MAFQFGPETEPHKFTLMPDRLLENGSQTSLTGMPLKLLWRLVEHAPAEFSNEAITNFLSPKGNPKFFARDRIGEIREVLGGQGKDAIRNDRNSGYRFAWPVHTAESEGGCGAPACAVGTAGTTRGILRHLHVSPGLLPRKAALEKLKRVLLRERGAGACTYLTAAAGMGGIGKTVLASLAMHDPEVQQRFPGGIIAITIGRKPSDLRLLELSHSIHEALLDSKPDWKKPEDAYDKLFQLLNHKAVLIVVDDLWDTKDMLRWLPQELGSSGILITTRHREIAIAVPSVATVEADFLTPDEARELLAFHAGTPVDSLPPEADRILLHCGHRHGDSRVPAFAVCMAGSMVRGVKNWCDVVELFGKSQIQEIGPQTPIDYQEHRTIYDWIHASVDFLPPEDRKRYLLCSGFQDDDEIKATFFGRLWRDPTGNLYTSWLRVLNDACLLNWSGNVVTFHDLHLDYLRFRASKRPVAR